MILTTPFHPRTEAANRTGLWSHWAGHLVADRYQISDKAEYFAVRAAAGVFDTSPLFKYRVAGPDAERFLGGILTRDVRRCPPGRAQYTVWCDDDGHVIEDGVVFRLAESDYLLTSARPNLAYLDGMRGRMRVDVVDLSRRYAALAVQGPRSRRVVERMSPELADLVPFGVTGARTDGMEVIVSRTGFTGDLGYELWVESDHALDLWDRVEEYGVGHGLLPVGQDAILVARAEAGLLLIDVDYRSSRFAWTVTERSSPAELGLGWMLSDLDGDRPFVGRQALRRAREQGTARWVLTGLVVDWTDWDAAHHDAGLVPRKDHRPHHGDLMVYRSGERVGWASTFLYSPMLQRHVALARVRPDLATPGTRVDLEVTIDHANRTVGAVVTRLPFYRPEHVR